MHSALGNLFLKKKYSWDECMYANYHRHELGLQRNALWLSLFKMH